MRFKFNRSKNCVWLSSWLGGEEGRPGSTGCLPFSACLDVEGALAVILVWDTEGLVFPDVEGALAVFLVWDTEGLEELSIITSLPLEVVPSPLPYVIVAWGHSVGMSEPEGERDLRMLSMVPARGTGGDLGGAKEFCWGSGGAGSSIPKGGSKAPPIHQRGSDSARGKKSWFIPILGYSENERKGANTSFGDGSDIPREAMDAYKGILEENCVDLKWKKGDVLLVDNLSVQHARRPGKPPRAIYVPMFPKQKNTGSSGWNVKRLDIDTEIKIQHLKDMTETASFDGRRFSALGFFYAAGAF
ncbi:hypothetical protein QJS10_CPB13g00858 [Acorus calamus]|uniref:TauD/TfdA-like domain-containing protein n=1 Tax=Acorus calamus TaxID=4465 RepID=A0AAV9DFI7_ACOCL|nr:hypothetical protein QJS10_CPB13g00858 [Acorus calamus]